MAAATGTAATGVAATGVAATGVAATGAAATGVAATGADRARNQPTVMSLHPRSGFEYPPAVVMA